MKCPICKSKDYKYVSYSDEIWGAIETVEQHGACNNCGYRIEQAYSDVMECFIDDKKGRKIDNKYYPKNIKKHKRYRKKSKSKTKGISINPFWSKYF